jgi:hypothetical protein
MLGDDMMDGKKEIEMEMGIQEAAMRRDVILTRVG